MRIAYVTAHLPPDFTSGATLLVERLAHEAVALGHEVEVLSGAINQGLVDGEVRRDPPTAARGFSVRWIGTSERIDQDDDGNWDNPAAAAAAREWLREFRPDVIHMHTLQTLGVGVVEEAVASGIRTVVTMHDLWWWCARLFLVDTELRPCPLVTDVNTCACARNAVWRSERAARLRRALDGVDRILAPSSALRDVIVANGVDPDRVTVDENHVVESLDAVGSPTPSPTQPVRFLYMGADSPLKGAGVLRQAMTLADDVDGWVLDAYGLARTDDLPAQCRVHPAFDPVSLPAILGRADALVIPSIARESFSIAAREALSAGLAVITSDCLGPEEVVVDGHNGLLVPTGDSQALADALRMLANDRTLLGRLRANARSEPPALRSALEQANGLLPIYAGPVASVRPHEPRRVAFVVGADGAMARYRVHHPCEALALRSGRAPAVAHYLDPELARATTGADVVVLQRVPATVQILELIDTWHAAGALVVFDTDDLIFDPELATAIPTVMAMPAPARERYLEGVRRYRTTLEACDGALVSTPTIAEHVRSLTGLPAVVVPNGLGLVELRLAETANRRRASRRAERVRIAYLSGSDSHQPDMNMVSGPIAAILDRHARVEFVVVGPVEPGPELVRFGPRVSSVGFQSWHTLPALLSDVDINVVPLVLPSQFNEAKSAVKWLEAAAMSVPSVASASQPFVDTIDDGMTGRLAMTPDDWVEALDELVDDDVGRARIGSAARRRAEVHHGPHITAFAYDAGLAALAEQRSQRPGISSWTPVAPDERAPSAPPLDAYDVDLAVDRRSGARRFRRWAARRLRR
ncbi:MAG TPA: glycosyltransferase [Ilumatobacteraceae bacterium]|nr:glycosyltransferase [Ilumatobacteraceae bacterium]